jgi:hypothetical protein
MRKWRRSRRRPPECRRRIQLIVTAEFELRQLRHDKRPRSGLLISPLVFTVSAMVAIIVTEMWARNA